MLQSSAWCVPCYKQRIAEGFHGDPQKMLRSVISSHAGPASYFAYALNGITKGEIMSEKKCANPACSCIPPDGQKFCSAHCESIKGSVEAICDCGHPACKGDALEA
jgi:hypothetical protein